jgi:hypothetical protein
MQVGGQSGINLLLRYGPAQHCGRAAHVHQQSLPTADDIFPPARSGWPARMIAAAIALIDGCLALTKPRMAVAATH